MASPTEVMISKKNLKIHIELMRIFAIFFVVFNHSIGYFLFTNYPPNSINFWLYLFFSIFSKVAVPLFFAISGALLLSRPQEPWRKLWVGRILRFSLILLIGSFYAYLEDIGLYTDWNLVKKLFSWMGFIKSAYSTALRAHFWFLYTYIAFLVLSPIIRSFVQNLETKYFYYMIAVALVYKAFIPITEYLIWKGDFTICSDFSIGWIAETILVFPCIGYFLEHRIQIHKSGVCVFSLCLASFVSILITCYMTLLRGNVMGGLNPVDTEYFHRSFDIVTCITVYTLIRYLSEHIRFNQRSVKMITSLGKCSFGIYFFHLLIKWDYSIINLISDKMLCAICTCFYQIAVCWILTAILKRIPVVKLLV